MIEVGILKTWDSAAYKAGVQLAGSLTAYFDEVNVARNIASSAMVVGNYVLVAMPEDNPKDGCVIAAWPGGSDAHHARHELGGADQVEVKDLIYLYQTGEYYKQWDSVTGWTENNTGGSNDPRGTFLYMQTGAVANNIVNIYMTPGYFWIGRWTRWAAEISIRYNHATNNQITAYFGLAEAPTDPGSNYHMAFFIDNANLKASTRGPGGTQVTDTGIDPARFGSYTLVMIKDSNTSIKFYVNGVLKATHTDSTKFPISSLNATMYIKTLADHNKDIFFYPLRAESYVLT